MANLRPGRSERPSVSVRARWVIKLVLGMRGKLVINWCHKSTTAFASSYRNPLSMITFVIRWRSIVLVGRDGGRRTRAPFDDTNWIDFVTHPPRPFGRTYITARWLYRMITGYYYLAAPWNNKTRNSCVHLLHCRVFVTRSSCRADTPLTVDLRSLGRAALRLGRGFPPARQCRYQNCKLKLLMFVWSDGRWGSARAHICAEIIIARLRERPLKERAACVAEGNPLG